jgi:photosystem II stability/assembly factor-like uncharacterized protein
MNVMRKIFLILLICNTIVNSQIKWEKLNGPVGASVAGLRTSGDSLIIGTGYSKAMVFFSINSGLTWQQSEIKLKNRFSDFLFTSEGNIVATAHKNGIYKSNDLKTWTRIFHTGEEFWSLGKDNNETFFAGTDNGKIYFSKDFGLTWNLAHSTNDRISKFTTTSNYIFAASTAKLFRKNFNLPNSVWEDISILNVSSYARVFTNGSDIYLFNNPSLYKSTDEGVTWSHKSDHNFFYGNYSDCWIYNNKIIGGFRDETSWFGNGWGVVISEDEGANWFWSNQGLPPKTASIYKIDKASDNTYLGTNAAGVFKSTDFGESWFPINNGITAANTLDICFDHEGTLYSANWSNGFQKSTDMGETWTVINNGLTNSYALSIIADDNGNLIGGTEEGTFRSTDKGENWVQTATVGNNFSYRLYKDNQNRIYSLNFDGGIFRTSDLGMSWIRLDKNFVSTGVFGLAIDSSGNLYAGTRGGWIYKSTNDGSSWTVSRTGTNSFYGVVMIRVAPNGNIFVSTNDQGMLRSTNNGATWENVTHSISWYNSRSLGINSKGEIFTSFAESYQYDTEEKIYYSNNNGESWIDYTTNLKLIGTRNFGFDKEDNVYLATDESVWRINPDSVTTIVKNEDKVYQFALMQNYPNPFNPVTKIKYSIPTSPPTPLQAERGANPSGVSVSLKIYDILGNEVTTLVNESKAPGEYEVEWNAANFSSGVYFYTLRAGGLVQTRKLVLLK